MMKRCFSCGETYSPLSIGTLNCKVHPLLYNSADQGKRFDAGRYECCGASKNPDSYYYERTHPRGCHDVDHVESLQELQTVLKKPYKCVSAEEFANMHVAKQVELEDEQEVVPVLSNERLSETLCLKSFFGKTHSVSFAAEHDKLLGSNKKSVADLDETELSALLYLDESEQGENGTLLCDVDDTIFQPFYVIRRVSAIPDTVKMAEIRPRFV